MTPKEEVAALRTEVAALRTEVADLRRFQSWVIGAVTGFGILLAFIADGIRKKLGFGS